MVKNSQQAFRESFDWSDQSLTQLDILFAHTYHQQKYCIKEI